MKRALALALPLLVLTGCSNAPARQPKISILIGIDVSGSFYNSGHYSDALDFLAVYLHGHLNEAPGLKRVKALFVGSIGGDMEVPFAARLAHPARQVVR